MLLALVLLLQTASATPEPSGLTPDQKIEAAAKAIVDDAGAPLVEKIDWTRLEPPPGAQVVPEMRVFMAAPVWHKTPRSLKRDAVDRLARLDWRSSSFAAKYSQAPVGFFVRVYVGETFLGRIEVSHPEKPGRPDAFKPSRAWADQ
jgi:hypothetical protein